MLCKSCNKPYDEKEKVPRILISCGHTQCEECIMKNLNKSKIQCSDCGKYSEAKTPVEFPKNLMLLSMVNNIINNPSTIIICPSHSKQIDAFCEECRSLICIDCILSGDHKNHEINPIAKSCEKERQRIKECESYCKSKEAELSNLCTQVQNYHTIIHEDGAKCIDNISNVFDEMRNSINARENELKKGITILLDKEDQMINQTLEEISQQNQNIDSFKSEVAKMETEDSLKMLQSKINREHASKLAMGAIPICEMTLILPNVGKEKEFMFLAKEFLPQCNVTICDTTLRKSSSKLDRGSPKKTPDIRKNKNSVLSTENVRAPLSVKKDEKAKAKFTKGNTLSKFEMDDKSSLSQHSQDDYKLPITGNNENKALEKQNLLKDKREQFKEKKGLHTKEVEALKMKHEALSGELKKAGTKVESKYKVCE